MSVNWVMLSEKDGFVPLPGEQRIHASPPRTALSVQSLNKFPGKQPWAVQSGAGRVYLTNRRIVYLPSTSSTQLESFAAPLLNLHDTHVSAPFFGPNAWYAVVQPVPGGGIPPEHAALELKLTFKEGGAFDYHTKFERLRERMQQAAEVAREGNPAGANNVHLEDLPAYSATGQSVPASARTETGNAQARTQAHSVLAGLTGQSSGGAASNSNPSQPSSSVPSEAPPAYDGVFATVAPPAQQSKK